MMRSMSLAISALRNHQVYMDVVASNISNVNTTGFKASRISFQELLNQTLRGSSAPRGGVGGLNPIQIGLGMAIGGVDTLFTQGSLQDTGKQTDLAIQGDGFFALDSGNGLQYARDGGLDIGVDGSLLHLATGMRVMGWPADNSGNIDTTQPLAAIKIPYGQSMARATSEMNLQGNLDAEAVAGTTVTATANIYDSLGVAHDVTLTFTKTGTANQWTWTASSTDPTISGITPTGTTISFNSDGSFSQTNPATSLSLTFTNGSTSPNATTLNISDLTQLMGLSDINTANQDGLPPGDLTTFTVGSTGELVGIFSNGLNRKLGQVALAKFLNPGGLLKMGQSLFAPSANSGSAQIGMPGQDGLGQISAGYLEMSNVELAQQFTSMIVAERGFQANSRVITTSDEMLQDLVNLKR
ncbi:MAG: flagellar hook protein FlgE [Anaerolineae bacterium]|nr:flagellar hook protein FlgE [Anaerolineae bacterium]